MSDHPFAMSVTTMKEFFQRSTSCLDERDSGYAPKPGMYTVAQQVAHAAHVIEWFVDGAFAPDGLPMDFEKANADLKKVTSLKAARAAFDQAIQKALAMCQAKSMADFMQPISPRSPIMANVPRVAIFESMAEHTAHHRGSLAVYSRLLGKAPKIPYMD